MLDIHTFLKRLASYRPIFHSEADFQHAFAWQLHEQYPEMQIRLEYPRFINERHIYLDIWAESADINIAVELKYKTKNLEMYYGNEHFILKNHGAHDIGRYDFLKDVERLETVIRNSAKPVLGFAVLLTNDKHYLDEAKSETIDKAFRLYKNRELVGELELAWGAGVGGTARNRENPITLTGTYSVTWETYYSFEAPAATFQYLAIQCS